MIAYLKKLLQVIDATISQQLAYVKGAYIGIASTALQIVILFFLWQVVYAGKDSLNGMTHSQMNSYLILSQAISMQFAFGLNNKVADDIYSGNITFDLLRPISYMKYCAAIKFGYSASVIFLRWPAIFLISIVFFGFGLPASLIHFFAFLVSLLLSFLLLFYVEFMVGLISFYTLNKYGVRTLKDALLAFLSGTLVPLSFLPGWLRIFTMALPFQYTVSVPANLYIGVIPLEQIPITLMNEIIWIVFLYLMAKGFYTISIKKITIQGG